MYTIKLTEHKDDELKQEFYALADNITLRRILRKPDEKDKEFADRAINENRSAPYDFYNFNNCDSSVAITFVNYFDEKDDYRTIILYDGARGFIMQNGKTVDKIFV